MGSFPAEGDGTGGAGCASARASNAFSSNPIPKAAEDVTTDFFKKLRRFSGFAMVDLSRA